MKITELITIFKVVIQELKESLSDNDKFRLKNYQKWLKILESLPNSTIFTTVGHVQNCDAIPDKLKTKMIELIEHGTLNGAIIEVVASSDSAVIGGHGGAQSPPVATVAHEDVEQYDLINFYGFGAAAAKTFAAQHITGSHLIHDWQQYIARNPTNSILMLSKRPPPMDIAATQWKRYTPTKQHAEILKALNQDLAQHTTYLHKLNYHQLIGVKHYFNIMTKIPRSELRTIEKVLKHIIARLNSDIVVMICGSYRRGRAESGDIDCLLSHSNITTNDNAELLNKIVQALTKAEFIVDHLTENGGTKYMGLCTVGVIPRRIDIRFICWQSYPFAVLYFTGSKNNNTAMRNVAKRKGYKLNEYALTHLEDGTHVECATEADIFKFLELPYLDPTQRDI
jgi:DNA polymerase/3'-5' exonuclease PolX